MRLIYGMIGVIIVAVGTIAVVTGDFAVDGGWLLSSGLATLGGAGLVATAAGASR